MARHRTPEERAQIVARYQETANASEVAREFDLTEGAVRKIVASAEGTKKYELHARAVSKAIRKARRSLARKVDTIDLYLLKHAKGDPDGVPNIEPRDLSSIINSSATVLARLLEAEQRIEARRAARLTRENKRLENELLRLKIKAGGVEQHAHSLVASVVVLPELDDDDSPVAAESRPADAGAQEHGE